MRANIGFLNEIEVEIEIEIELEVELENKIELENKTEVEVESFINFSKNKTHTILRKSAKSVGKRKRNLI